MVDSFRFLTIFAAALAAWIVLMWLTLAAVSASENAQTDQSHAPGTPPASAIHEPPSSQGSAPVGTGSKIDAGMLVTPGREGGVA